MRYDLQKAFDVIEACAILHNLSIKWNDIMPRWMYDDGEDGLKMHLVKINSVHASVQK